MKKIMIGYSIATISLLAITGCGGSSNGTASGNTVPTGNFNLSITDGPIDSARHVYVTFSGVEVSSASESFQFDFEKPKTIDLLEFQGSASAPLLEGIELDPGSYEEVRLKLVTEGDQDTYIVFDDGSEHELTILQYSQSGLKLNHKFDISENGAVDLTIDFDLRKSIMRSKTNGNASSYKLRPTLRITDNSEIGHIKGLVDATWLSRYTFCHDDGASDLGGGRAVYIFNGIDVTPDDEGSKNSPVASSLLNYDEERAEYIYAIGFLDAGNYTLALTCDPKADRTEEDDEINFIYQSNVTVEKKRTTTFDINK